MAIAFVTGATGAFVNPNTTLSVTLNCTGADKLIVSTVGDSGSDTITGVTYSGAAMTKVASVANGRYVSMWYLDAPASGSNSITVSLGASSYIEITGACYSGVETGAPEAQATNTGAGTSISGSVTTITDNAWVMMAALITGGSLAGGSGTTLRGASGLIAATLDSDGAVTPAGSKTLTATGSSGDCATVVAAFAPSSGGGGGSSTGAAAHYYRQLQG